MEGNQERLSWCHIKDRRYTGQSYLVNPKHICIIPKDREETVY